MPYPMRNYDYYGQAMSGEESPDIGSLIAGQGQSIPQQQPDLVRQILSSRFEPDFQDLAHSALAGVAGNTYVSPQSFADNRMQNAMKQLMLVGEMQKNQAMVQLYKSGGSGSQTLKLVQALNEDRIKQGLPPLDTATALAVVKSPGAMPMTASREGTSLVNVPGSTSVAGSMAYEKESGQRGAELQYTGPIARSRAVEAGRGETQAEKEKQLPKATARMMETEQGAGLVKSTIKQAKAQSKWYTTGLPGAVTKGVPGTPAFDLARTVDTIKANVGFDKLQRMREISPTGGALGQVAVQEIIYLQSTLSNLEQSQSKEQFDRNLDIVDTAYDSAIRRLRNAYAMDFGTTEGFEEFFSQTGMEGGPVNLTGGKDQQTLDVFSPQRTILKTQISPSTNKRKIIYSDGTEEIK